MSRLPVLFLGTVATITGSAWSGPVLYVDDDAAPGGDGLSWATAYRHLQDGLAAAAGGGVEEIRVAQGLYRADRYEANPSGTGDRNATFELPGGAALRGGYAGQGAPDPDARDPQQYVTTLSGDLLGNDDPQDNQTRNDNSFHVVTADEAGPAELSGFTITAGDAGKTAPLLHGAGVLAMGADIVISECAFVSNRAYGAGGGLSVAGGARPQIIGCNFIENDSGLGGGAASVDSSPVFESCGFSTNVAGSGGGLAVEGGQFELTECAFTGNDADFFDGGGGVRCNASTGTVTDCTFEANHSSEGGGGIITHNGSTLTVEHCTFLGNTTFAIAGGAGMMNRSGSRAVVLASTFTDNESYGRGAGLYDTEGSTSFVSGCIFSSNKSSLPGGAAASGASHYTDCTFTGNFAEEGGGALNLAGPARVVDCTFTLNQAFGGDTAGGAIRTTGDALVTGCQFEGNESSRGGGIAVVGGSPTIVRCTLIGNSASFPGGGLHVDDGASPSVIECTFLGNDANDAGGVLVASGSSPVLINCLFSGNTGLGRAGLWNAGGSSTLLVNCAFSRNHASITLGGIDTTGSSSTLTLVNCILWGNTDADGATGTEAEQIHFQTVPPAISYSCVQGWTGALGGQGNTGADPLFLDADGGDGTPGTLDDDLRLSAGSPLVDAGDNGALTCIETDLDRHERFFDDPSAPDVGSGTAPLIDMGPYERLAPPAVTTDCNENAWEDICETAQGISPDCNGNGSPDECDVTDGISSDCNLNGVPDECEPSDCNGNGVPDDCDIADGASGDCNDNGIPDECEAPDCNANGVPDECDIEDGTSIDFNDNGVPDECDIIHVPGDVPTIQGAINQALHAFTILVAPGVYPETIDFSNKKILVQGTGGADVTVINGQGLGASVVRFGVTSPPGTTQTLEGFTVTGGDTLQGGGATVVIGATPTVRSCTFLGNHASTGGGVFVPSGATPAFLDCTFEGNTAGFGAGLMNLGGTPAITGCLFAGNRADTAGGAIYSLSAPALVASSTFCENSPDDVSGQWTDGGGNVFVATCPRPCPADLDGDGFVGVIDFLELLKAWDTSPGGPPDLDGDGIVGVTDFLELLKHWGPCPPG